MFNEKNDKYMNSTSEVFKNSARFITLGCYGFSNLKLKQIEDWFCRS